MNDTPAQASIAECADCRWKRRGLPDRVRAGAQRHCNEAGHRVHVATASSVEVTIDDGPQAAD
jgi:hypothetical protein